MNFYKHSSFTFLDNGDLPIAFAHQGAGDVVGMDNRNTMRAFDAAVSEGYQYLETDVICSADEKIVVTHGAGSAQEASFSGLPLRSQLENMTLSEIQAKYLFSGQPMPELQEVFRTYPDVRLNIDAKTTKAAHFLPRVIEQNDARDRVCIASFDYSNTKIVARALGGQEKVCTATGKLGGLALLLGGRFGSSYLSRTKAACLQLPHETSVPCTGGRLKVQVTKGMVDLAAEHGLRLHVWTPNKLYDMERVIDAGVQGIMTDETRMLKKLLINLNHWPNTE